MFNQDVALPEFDQQAFDNLWDTWLCETADPTITSPRYREGRYIQQDYTEVLELVKLLCGLKPQRALEIGNACGGTTLVWQLITPLVVSLDLYEIGSGDGVIVPAMFPRTKFFLGSSHDQSMLEQAKEFAPYDFLFIDGDHDTEGARMDYDMYAPLVREGGVVAFHDWGYHHVRAAIDSIIRDIGQQPEVIQHSHFGIAVFRK
jgi:cephalosporin hydroxylase